MSAKRRCVRGGEGDGGCEKGAVCVLLFNLLVIWVQAWHIIYTACYIDRAYPFNRLYSDSVAHCISRAGFSNFHDAHRIPHTGIYHLFSSITLPKSHKSRKTWKISAKRAMRSKCIRRCSKQTGETGSETQRARRYLYIPHCQRV